MEAVSSALSLTGEEHSKTIHHFFVHAAWHVASNLLGRMALVCRCLLSEKCLDVPVAFVMKIKYFDSI